MMNELRDNIEAAFSLYDSISNDESGDVEMAIDAILDAVIAALPEERQRAYVLEGGEIISEEGNQRFHRYGGYDAALTNVKRILQAAKESK